VAYSRVHSLTSDQAVSETKRNGLRVSLWIRNPLLDETARLVETAPALKAVQRAIMARQQHSRAKLKSRGLGVRDLPDLIL